MIGTPDEIKFVLAAEDKLLVNAMKNAGTSVDQLQKKVEKLNNTTADASKKIGDRQINKELNFDSAGDVLELLGITEKGLATIKKFGIGLGVATAAASTLSKVLNGIADNKKASQIWVEVAEGIPVLGGIAKAFDDAGSAIGRYKYDVDAYLAQDKRVREDFAAKQKLLSGITAGGLSAREQLRISQSANPELERAQIEFEKTSGRVAGERSRINALGGGHISNEARAQALKDLDDQLLAANDRVQRAAMDAERKKKDESDKARKQQIDDDKKGAEEIAKNAIEAAKWAEQQKAIERKRQLENMRSEMEGINSLHSDIASANERIADEEQRRAKDFSANTRTGALAETFGLGTSNQLASRERASASIQINIAKDQLEIMRQQRDSLKKLEEAASRGEVTPIFFN